MYRNGGGYPENAVKERANLGKFSCVLLCLIPTSYLSNLPTTVVYISRGKPFHQHVNKINCKYIFCSWVGQKISGVLCSGVEISCSSGENGGE